MLTGTSKNYEEALGFRKGLLPEERLLVSEWADKYRFLASGASPEAGLYKTSRTPYLKKIMDALSDHISYRRVIFKKSAQVGATELGLNWIGYSIDNSPATMLMVMPTEAQAKRNSKMRLDPMIRATPRLSSKVMKDGDTILQKDFPGGSLICAGANSPSGLRSMPIKKLMLDEVDGYPLDLGGEGSPMSLARARTRNYKNSKTFVPSTPTVEGVSVVEDEYEKTDKQKFYVPCPHCGVYDHLTFENVKWEGNDFTTSPPTAHYQCPYCDGKIYERHKRDMLAKGEWKATDPEKTSTDIIGFHINSLYSPWYSFSDLVADYIDAGTDQNKLNSFTNLSLGEPSKPQTDAPKWQSLYDRAKSVQENKPNNNVKFVTVGVDVQGNRLELSVVGWGHGKRRWLLDYRVLVGNVHEDSVWQELALVVNEFWIREDGIELPMSRMCVDSGNYTARVYKFCKAYSHKQVVPVKGQDNLGRIIGSVTAVDKTEAGKDAPGVRLVNVGSSFMKTELYGYLKLHKLDEDELGPPGYIHLIKFQDKYFKGLVAEEERVKKDKKGHNKTEWHVTFERNEPLDTMNYARAAASLMGIDRFDDRWMDNVESSFKKRTVQPATVKPTTHITNKEGSFWE